MNIELLDINMITTNCCGKTQLAAFRTAIAINHSKSVLFLTCENTIEHMRDMITQHLDVGDDTIQLIIVKVGMGGDCNDIENLIIHFRHMFGSEPDMLVIDSIEYMGIETPLDAKLKLLSDLKRGYDIDIWTTLNTRRSH